LQAAFVLVIAFVMGCVSFEGVRCENGRICPPGGRCDDNGGCILPTQIAACEGMTKVDGDECTIDGAGGTCVQGGCVAWFCGDHTRNGAEQCEDDDLGGKTCLDFGWNNSTGLECDGNCMLDDSGCTGGCGDNQKDETEQCDGAIDPSIDCTNLGFYEPDGLTCSGYCRFDVDACKGFCPDGLVNGPEQCDSAAPYGETCLDYSFDAGRLGCTLCSPGFEGCAKLGWQREVSPTTQTIRAIWGAAPDEFLAVGNAGTVLRHSGSQLAQVPGVPTSQNLNGVWGETASNVFIVGNAGTVLRYNGATLTTMTSNTSDTLFGVWGADATHVFAVGIAGTIIQYDGNNWSPSTHGSAILRAVWGSSASDVYAVGDANTVLHYDGTNWSASTVLPALTGNPIAAYAVWGSGPTDVFVAGKNVSNQPVLLHYDGSWTVTNTGSTTGLNAGLWGSGGSNVFVVGPPPLHFDGTRPSVLPTPPGLFSPSQLWAAWGTPTGSVWVAGDGGYIARWDSASWTLAPTLTGTKLRAVASVGTSDAFSVGSTTAGASLRYDGVAWNPLTVPVASGDALRSVWMANGSFGAAVGVNGSAGVVYHFGGTSWAAPCAAASTARNAVWGATNADVYAVGAVDGSNQKAISHWDGSCWANTTFVGPAGGSLQLFGVWGATSTDVFAAGARTSTFPTTAALYRGSGNTWTEMTLPLSNPAVATSALTRIDGVWGSGASDVFAVGDGIVHFNGTSWSNMIGPGQALRAISGTGPRNVFAVGDNGRLLHYDGISWTPIRVPAPTGMFLRGVAATSRSLVVVGEDGSNGFAQRLSFSVRPTEINCRDAWDDDGDGMPDCADADCAGDDYCKAGGVCPPVNDTPLACGAMITDGSTIGRTPARDYYTCNPNPETGPESIYELVPATSGSTTVTLSGFGSAELDLVVVGAMTNTPACDPDAACIGSSAQTGSSTETVTFTATAGRSYYLIVDGRNGASSTFNLGVSCP
jgi:hypothetical protein